MTTRNVVLAVCAAEAICIALVLIAPGAGHSPLWFTLFPALLVVARIAPTVGTCLECAPRAWVVGVGLQTVLLVALTLAHQRLKGR